MVRGRRAWSWVVVVGLVLALGACSDEPQEQPEGAVQLRENLPTPVGELNLVAGNIWDESIVLSVDDGDGAAQNAGLSVGERATIKGRTFELLSIHEDMEESAPGGSGSYAWVLPVD
ncbi:hypothetical protein [Cellulomonas sp. S1-8]|uniref:hypothetical protein n=1 Tax=Cellulomonas sp. S1-8 TaxID=2904790 RepID=UPI002243D7C7|nr:hypothetical protein [Cellulomonas sp. S1-8]UZN02265.1 hypothetical protein OKX07_14360 [Cellulomonas sp. S1-8]